MTACPLCGGLSARTAWRIDRWRVAVCRHCGQAFTDPVPDSAALAAAYDRDYYEARGIALSTDDDEGRRRTFGGVLDRIEQFEPSGRLLELGCGPGWLLRVARERGWDVTGVDISPTSVEFGRTVLGLPIECGDLEVRPSGEPSFDAVVGLHVLEHLPDPRAALRRIHRLLKPNGALLLAVPNVATIDVWLSPRRRRELLDLPWHLFHFTLPTLSRLVAGQGFEPIWWEVDFPDVLRRLVPRRLTDSAGRGAAAARASSWRLRLKRRLPGGQIVMVARRRSDG